MKENWHFSELSAPFDCPICGQEAGKHTHYGGKGCSSCRAFFRRSVQSGAFQSFKCRNEIENQCEIDSKSWKSCKFCRFNKCLQSGMKPAYVLNEEERKIRHQKRTSGSSSGSSSGSLSGSSSGTGTRISLPTISTTLLNDNMTEDEMMVFIQSQGLKIMIFEKNEIFKNWGYRDFQIREIIEKMRIRKKMEFLKNCNFRKNEIFKKMDFFEFSKNWDFRDFLITEILRF